VNTAFLCILIIYASPCFFKVEEEGESVLTTEKIKPRKKLPPLLVALKDRRPERLHWFGTSYGLTPQLYNFWGKANFLPVYIRQTANEVTGEHSVIMLRGKVYIFI
jgi:N-acetyltransferase 10